jgi:hypothetical protein
VIRLASIVTTGIRRAEFADRLEVPVVITLHATRLHHTSPRSSHELTESILEAPMQRCGCPRSGSSGIDPARDEDPVRHPELAWELAIKQLREVGVEALDLLVAQC